MVDTAPIYPVPLKRRPSHPITHSRPRSGGGNRRPRRIRIQVCTHTIRQRKPSVRLRPEASAKEHGAVRRAERRDARLDFRAWGK